MRKQLKWQKNHLKLMKGLIELKIQNINLSLIGYLYKYEPKLFYDPIKLQQTIILYHTFCVVKDKNYVVSDVYISNEIPSMPEIIKEHLINLDELILFGEETFKLNNEMIDKDSLTASINLSKDVSKYDFARFFKNNSSFENKQDLKEFNLNADKLKMFASLYNSYLKNYDDDVHFELDGKIFSVDKQSI